MADRLKSVDLCSLTHNLRKKRSVWATGVKRGVHAFHREYYRGMNDIPSRDRPRWVAFGVILGCMSLLLVTPAVAGAVLPPREVGEVGVYERVTLQGGNDEGRSVMGGFIAPQGWMLDPVATTPAGVTHANERTLWTKDDGVRVTASLQSGVTSSEELLRAGAPAGAFLAPIERLDSAPLLTIEVLEYDLQAGDARSQRIAVCEILRSENCVLFEVEVAASRSGADADTLLPDVAAMVQSTEVSP